jgi:hypothetical protein
VVFGKGYDNYLLVVDDIKKSTASKTWSWQMYTAASNMVTVDNQAKLATITGGRTGAQCKVISLWPSTAVFSYDDTNDLITISDIAVNGRFVTLIISPQAGHSLPQIQTSGSPASNMTIWLSFADGSTDTITIVNGFVTFSRN